MGGGGWGGGGGNSRLFRISCFCTRLLGRVALSVARLTCKAEIPDSIIGPVIYLTEIYSSPSAESRRAAVSTIFS